MKYVLLFCGTRADQAALEALSQGELAERYAQVGRWFAEHREVIGPTSQLQPPETATAVASDLRRHCGHKIVIHYLHGGC